MKTIGFIGAYDKMDFIIYVAKILTSLGKKVLIIDSTITEKARYIVPAITPTKSYVTEFEKIDVSVGFNRYNEIKGYLGVQIQENLEYDFILIDIDTTTGFEEFGMENAHKNYFVTSFDVYSLKKGLDIFNNVTNPIKLTKILFTKDILKEDDDYLNFISLGKKIIWNEDYVVYIPFNDKDQSIIMENQRVEKIAIRKLSNQYKESLYYVIEDIIGDEVNSRRYKKSV